MNKGAPIAEGRTAVIFDWGDGHVLKQYRPGWEWDVANYEASLSRAVHAAGLQTPAVIDVLDVDGRPGIIFQRIDGPTMLHEILAAPDRTTAHARLLAELHAAMHSRHAAELPSLKQRLQRKIQNAPPLPDNWKRAILSQLDQLPDGNAICHGDFHPDNVVMAAGGPVIIDWIDASQGNPLADVSRTLLLAGQGTPDETVDPRIEVLRRQLIETYLARYGELRPFDPVELSAWQLPVTAGRLSEGISAEEERLLAAVKALLDG
jgi:uncharacterized protein (TIGR02172 family)